MNNEKQEAQGLWIDTDGWSKRLDAIVAQTPKIDHEDVFKRIDETVEKIKTEKPTMIIDPLFGLELNPGDPENCQGNGKEDPMTCCCDECDYYTKCFPEWAPGGSAWKEDNENAGH